MSVSVNSCFCQSKSNHKGFILFCTQFI
uniref:Uncharacterized protein n=1 Tax=Arundo donax TaxID=35708 RepID=A0A0A8YPP3_ARUDO